ncbi:hypothetical protein D3C77_556260 [compost metagenome]
MKSSFFLSDPLGISIMCFLCLLIVVSDDRATPTRKLVATICTFIIIMMMIYIDFTRGILGGGFGL